MPRPAQFRWRRDAVNEVAASDAFPKFRTGERAMQPVVGQSTTAAPLLPHNRREAVPTGSGGTRWQERPSSYPIFVIGRTTSLVSDYPTRSTLSDTQHMKRLSYIAMKRPQYTFTILLALAMVAFSFPGGQTQLMITDASRMWIDGTSTIHDWTCSVGEVDGSITLDAARGEVSKAVVTVPSASIDCDNGTMNKKMSKALDIRSHPAIRYTLTNADVAKDGNKLRVEALGTLELAGAKKDVAASLVGEPGADGSFRFTGTLPVKMSDFGIAPPTAMLGTLKSGNDVTVRFEVLATSSNLSSSK